MGLGPWSLLRAGVKLICNFPSVLLRLCHDSATTFGPSYLLHVFFEWMRKRASEGSAGPGSSQTETAGRLVRTSLAGVSSATRRSRFILHPFLPPPPGSATSNAGFPSVLLRLLARPICCTFFSNGCGKERVKDRPVRGL